MINSISLMKLTMIGIGKLRTINISQDQENFMIIHNIRIVTRIKRFLMKKPMIAVITMCLDRQDSKEPPLILQSLAQRKLNFQDL